MSMSERDKRTMKIGALVVAAALVMKLVVMPVLGGWSAAREKVAAYETRLVSTQRMLDERAMAMSVLRQKFGPAVDKDLLTEAQARVEFPQAAQAALRNGGMNVQTVQVPSVRRVRELPGVSMVTVRVDGTCEGGQVARMLAALRDCERIAVVEQFEVSMAQPGNRQSWTVRMTLSTPAVQGAAP